MSEQEAKSKLCPFVGIIVSGNSSYKETSDLCCVASGCMMWRWNEGGKPIRNNKNSSGNVACGYCGLAGKF